LAHLIVKNNTIKKVPNNIPKNDVEYLVRILANKYGYFELIKGKKKDKAGIYFTEYQNSKAFTGIIETLYEDD
jgi:hypothetical protein